MSFDLTGFKQIYSPNDKIAPYYYINSNGDVYSKYSNKFLTHCINHNGYEFVNLNTTDGNRVQRKIHRLVLTTFGYFPGCENLQVDHGDGNKHNNNISNLEFVTPKVNINRAIENNLRAEWRGTNNPHNKLNENEVLDIVEMALNGFNDDQIQAKYTNISMETIRLILLGKIWTNIIPADKISIIREMRMPTIVSNSQKHQLCKYFQDNISNYVAGYGAAKNFIISALNYLNIENNESTYRIAKRLFYRYQDPEITSQYIY